jgi:hypothetical protein
MLVDSDPNAHITEVSIEDFEAHWIGLGEFMIVNSNQAIVAHIAEVTIAYIWRDRATGCRPLVLSPLFPICPEIYGDDRWVWLRSAFVDTLIMLGDSWFVVD